MIKSARGVVKRICPHDYELRWQEVRTETKAYECRYCGKRREESSAQSASDPSR